MSSEDQPRPDGECEREPDDTEVGDGEETMAEALGDLLDPDPPYSPASEADAPPPG